MITFFCCLALLLVAYFTWGRFLDFVFKVDKNAAVPSKANYDGVDYVPMPLRKTFLIQFLNIAGLGPIFGAILGAAYGPVAFLWITLGGIFMGSVQDFASGVISTRNKGLNFPDIVGKYLGGGVKGFMRVFILFLMVLVGVVFVKGPADIIASRMGGDIWIWVAVIFAYYIVATLLPIDKLIGKIYPVFGVVLILMAVLILYVLLFDGYVVDIPELAFKNMMPNAEKFPIIPTMCITIACGAISGFHSTQSPLMARCLNNEKECRPIFFGAMICESIVALIWAAIAMAFFGGVDGLNAEIAATHGSAAVIIDNITTSTLGVVGAILVVLGVIFAPISTGDTAFRMARLIAADLFSFSQSKMKNRILLSLPIFAVAFVLMNVDFDIIWRYFAWCNQLLGVFALWAFTSYLAKGRYYFVTLIPAVAITFIVTLYILVAPEGFGVNYNLSLAISAVVALGCAALFFARIKQCRQIQ